MTKAAFIFRVFAGVLLLAVTVGASSLSAQAGAETGAPQSDPHPTPERTLYVRVCGDCHDVERIESLRRTESEWRGTIFEMIDAGSEASDAEYQTILAYLVSNYGAVAINRAEAEDLVAVLAISRKDADAIVAYRAMNGDFDDFDDLSSVPGIDVEKLEKRKASLRFY